MEAGQAVTLDLQARWAAALTQSEAQTSGLIGIVADARRCSAEAREIFRRYTR